MTHRRSLIELHVAVLLFGGAALFAKIIDLSPQALTLGRAAVAAAFVIATLAIGGSTRVRPSGVQATLLIVAGLLLAVHWSAFFRAVQVSTVSIAVVTVSTFPVFTAVIEPLSRRRLPTVADLGLALIAVSGIAVIVWPLDTSGSTAAGVAWGVGAAALFAALTVINGRLVDDLDSRTLAAWQYVAAAAVLAPGSLDEVVSVGLGDAVAVVIFGVVFTGVAHTLFISSMRTIRSQTASLSVGLEPVYGVLAAWLLLDERPGSRVIAGGVIVIGAVIVGSRLDRKRT